MANTLNSILNPVAPNLPLAPRGYDARYQDQLNNVLRLYFNRLGDNSVGVLLGDMGAQHLNAPLLSAYDTTTQYDGSTTIPYAVRFNSTGLSSGISIQSRLFSGTGSITLTTMTITAVTSGRLFSSMLLSGSGVTSGTYVYLQLSSTATPIAGTQSFVSGGGVGTDTFIVSGGAGRIETLQFVSGTGVPANTRVISATYDSGTGNTTVVLNANFTVQAAGTYVFRPWGYQGTYSVSPSQTVGSTTITGDLPSLIVPTMPGIFNVQFSLQFSNTDNNTIHEVDVWFRKNAVDLPDSNSRFSIPGKHSGLNGQLIAALNYFAQLDAGDELELMWHTDNSNISIETIPATTNPTRPETPSAIITVSFVSTYSTA